MPNRKLLYSRRNSAWCRDNLEGDLGWGVGGRFKRERTWVLLWLIHVGEWQKPTQYCKAVIFHLKINTLKKKNLREYTISYILYTNNNQIKIYIIERYHW